MKLASNLPPALARRPIVAGMPVPYVTLWSDEANWSGARFKVGPEGIIASRGLTKRWGMHWTNTPTISTGRVLWAQTHIPRGFRCMHKMCCTMCGEPIEGLPYWRVPNSGMPKEMWEKDRLTSNPPLCADCDAVAEDICPHLRSVGTERARGRATPYAAYGELINALGMRQEAVVELHHPARALMLARGLIVRVEVESSS